MKLICICGEPNSKKDWVARKLAEDPNITYVRPFTNEPVHFRRESYEDDDLIHMNNEKLDYKMQREIPLAVRVIGDTKYVFFKNQLKGDYVVLVCDKSTMMDLSDEYDVTSIYTSYGVISASLRDYDIFLDTSVDIDYDNLVKVILNG